MDQFCPECNSAMTPSLVGYLCINCGHAKRFYSQSQALSATAVAQPAMEPSHHTEDISTPTPQPYKSSSIKQTLARLMIPELPAPHQLIKQLPSRIAHPPLKTGRLGSYQAPVATSVAKLPNQASSLEELQLALHPKKDTSLWIMLALAVTLLLFAAAVLFLIILR